MTIFALLIMFIVPAFMLRLTKINTVFKTIGAVTLCYALGFILSFSGLPYDKGLSETVASVMVAIAIPLLLFSFDIRQVKLLAKKTLISFALVAVSVITVSTAAAFIANSYGIKNAPALSGMATGLYIGGTPNLFAIGKALLGKDSAAINLANISDSLMGGVYFLLLVSVIKNLYSKFLGKGRGKFADDISVINDESADNPHFANAAGYTAESEYDYSFLKKENRNRKDLLKLAAVFFQAVLCLGIGVGIEILVNGNMDGSLFIMVSVSVLGIIGSLIKPVRQVKGTYQTGQYLILVFSLGLAMSFDLSKLVDGILPTLIFFTCVQVASLGLHMILCKIFGIDGGTAIVTGTAGIYGPPFIAPVANAYGDRKLIVPGVICGTIGLIFGNIIGISLGTILSAII